MGGARGLRREKATWREAGHVQSDVTFCAWQCASAVARLASGSVAKMASERKTKLSKNLLRMKVRGLGVAGVSDGAAELRNVP